MYHYFVSRAKVNRTDRRLQAAEGAYTSTVTGLAQRTGEAVSPTHRCPVSDKKQFEAVRLTPHRGCETFFLYPYLN